MAKIPYIFKRLALFLALYTSIAIIYIDRNPIIEAMTNLYPLFLLPPVLTSVITLRRGMELKPKDSGETVAWIGLALAAYAIPAHILFISFPKIFPTVISYSLPFMLGTAFLCMGYFTWEQAKKYKKDIMLMGALMLTVLGLEYIFGIYWGKIVRPTLYGVEAFFGLMEKSITIRYHMNSMRVEDFGVHIGAPCSGIFSMIIFTILYVQAVYFTMNLSRLRYGKLFMLWLLGMGLLFVGNIFRISGIMLIGAYYSEDIAIGIFHEYAGAAILMLLFVVYATRMLPLLATGGGHVVPENNQ